MQRYKFSELKRELVGQLVDVREADGEISWQPKTVPLTEEESYLTAYLQRKLQREPLKKKNEATVWSKAIYPLLEQAETNLFGAWSQIEITADFAQFTLEGIADGVIGKQKVGYLSSPYLVVVEAKRDIEAKDPQPQLYGAMLAAAKINWNENQRDPQIIHGCYTVGDSWTFLLGEVEQITAEKPVFSVKLSREFAERSEADNILSVLKAIVNEQQN